MAVTHMKTNRDSLTKGWDAQGTPMSLEDREKEIKGQGCTYSPLPHDISELCQGRMSSGVVKKGEGQGR